MLEEGIPKAGRAVAAGGLGDWTGAELVKKSFGEVGEMG